MVTSSIAPLLIVEQSQLNSSNLLSSKIKYSQQQSTSKPKSTTGLVKQLVTISNRRLKVSPLPSLYVITIIFTVFIIGSLGAPSSSSTASSSPKPSPKLSSSPSPSSSSSSKSKNQRNNKQKVILILADGVRYDYIKDPNLKGIQRMAKTGVKAEYVQPIFPSNSYPNWYTIVTGNQLIHF